MAGQELVGTNIVRPGMDIIMSKWIALEGTVSVVRAKRQELQQRLPEYLLQSAERFADYMTVETELSVALREGAAAYPLSEGGIFSGLWRMAEAFGIGLEIQLRRIPVRQETIEICECFRLNPYQLLSTGAVLLASEKGHDLADNLQREGIAAAVIGKATAGNDRILWNEEERRYLDRPQRDELYRLPVEQP